MTLPLGILFAAIAFVSTPALAAAADDYRAGRSASSFRSPRVAARHGRPRDRPKLSERWEAFRSSWTTGVERSGHWNGIAAKATPDGYTLLVCDTAHTIQRCCRSWITIRSSRSP